MFICLWSCLFCCSGFRVFFLLFGRGRGRRPRPNSKKNTSPPKRMKKKKKKNINTHPPHPSLFFFAVWAGGRVYLFAVWAGGVFCFLLFGPGACFFCCLGGCMFVFFCSLGGVLFVFWLFGRGPCFFLLFGRGTGVHSLTGLPGSSLSDPTTKRTKQQNKKECFPSSKSSWCTCTRRPPPPPPPLTRACKPGSNDIKGPRRYIDILRTQWASWQITLGLTYSLCCYMDLFLSVDMLGGGPSAPAAINFELSANPDAEPR